MNPVILIPAFNPPKLFPHLLKTVESVTDFPILIVDDGSIPPIKHVSHTILRNEKNMGKGNALLTGLNHALNAGYTHAVTLDADAQHDPVFIKEFLRIKPETALVYGKREFHKDMPIHRRFSNKLTSLLISLISRKSVLDSQCGYRRYHLEKTLKHHYKEQGFQFETEVLLNLAMAGEKFAPIPITTLYQNESSSINNILDTFKFIRLIIRSCFMKMGVKC